MFHLKDKYVGIIKECTTNGAPRFMAQPPPTITVVELNKFSILSSNDIIHRLYKEDKGIVKINKQ